MPRPKNKSELERLAQENFDKLLSYIEDISEDELKNKKVCEEWTSKDILAHLHEWHKMSISWYKEGMKGVKPEIPAPGYSFKDTLALNEKLYQESKGRELGEVLSDLKKSHSELIRIIKNHSNEELFTKKKYKWTSTTSMGAYFISATSSHYDWAFKAIKKGMKE